MEIDPVLLGSTVSASHCVAEGVGVAEMEQEPENASLADMAPELQKEILLRKAHNIIITEVEAQKQHLSTTSVQRRTMEALLQQQHLSRVQKLGSHWAEVPYRSFNGIVSVIKGLLQTQGAWKTVKVQEFWEHGSSIVKPRYLRSIGYGQTDEVSPAVRHQWLEYD